MMSHTGEQRRCDRTRVLLRASIEQHGRSFQVRVLNLSSEGALVVGPALSDKSALLFEREGQNIRAQVAWTHGGASGLSFEQNVEVSSMLRKTPMAWTATRPCIRRPAFAAAGLSE